MTNFRHLRIVWLSLWLAVSTATAQDEGMKAYAALYSSTSFPKSTTEADHQAMRAVRAAPRALIDHLIRRFSSGGAGDARDRAILGLLPGAPRIEIARASVDSFVTPCDSPLLAVLAYEGDALDVPRLRSAARRSAKDAADIARLIVDANNAPGIAMLRTLRTDLGAEWQQIAEVERALDAFWEGLLCEWIVPRPIVGMDDPVEVGLRFSNQSRTVRTLDLPIASPLLGTGLVRVERNGEALPNPSRDRAVAGRPATVLAPGESLTLLLDLRAQCADTALGAGDTLEVWIASASEQKLRCRAVGSAVVHVASGPRPPAVHRDWGLARAMLLSDLPGGPKSDILLRAWTERPDLFWSLLESVDDPIALNAALRTAREGGAANADSLLRQLEHRDLSVRRAAMRTMEKVAATPQRKQQLARRLETFLETQKDGVVRAVTRDVINRFGDSK